MKTSVIFYYAFDNYYNVNTIDQHVQHAAMWLQILNSA